MFQNGTNESGEARWKLEHSENIIKGPPALEGLMCIWTWSSASSFTSKLNPFHSHLFVHTTSASARRGVLKAQLSGRKAHLRETPRQRPTSLHRKMVVGGQEEGRAEGNPWCPLEWLRYKHNWVRDPIRKVVAPFCYLTRDYLSVYVGVKVGKVTDQSVIEDR